MNIMTTIILIALGLSLWLLSRERGASRRLRDSLQSAAQTNEALHRKYQQADTLVAELRHQRDESRAFADKCRKLAEDAAKAAPRRPARLSQEDAMPEERIEELLAGTAATGPVRAILAHVSAKVVAACDVATDEPRELMTGPDRTIPPYTSEMRLHDAGKASAYGILLADLQRLTAATTEKPI